ncbi:UBP19 [Symbiodinium natans]|uniref:UBP19 protein n=1 Tax=Symbiodinium natans TaxID=878477 RepID=A0A812G9L2_9DINO|nr:UBP19 [Symbiodinium natans]
MSCSCQAASREFRQAFLFSGVFGFLFLQAFSMGCSGAPMTMQSKRSALNHSSPYLASPLPPLSHSFKWPSPGGQEELSSTKLAVSMREMCSHRVSCTNLHNHIPKPVPFCVALSNSRVCVCRSHAPRDVGTLQSMALFSHATSSMGTGPKTSDCLWWWKQAPIGLRPQQEEHFLECSLKERTHLAGELSAVSGIFPPWVYCYHGVRLLLYAGSCSLHAFYAVACCGSTARGLLSAFARATLWTALLEICGFCNMTGPLGRGQGCLEPLWHRLTAGTLKQPLLPYLPRKRGLADQLLFVLYLGSASCFLASSRALDESLVELRLTLLLLMLLCLVDRTAYTGSCGAYYFPLLFCLAAGGEASGAAGCQLVQLAHLFMPGVAKMGPWFPHVLPSMVGICPFLPHFLKENMFKRDSGGQLQLLRPSLVADIASACVVFLEIVCPVLLVCPWERLQVTGVVLAVFVHLSIVFLMPPGAVGEWNLFNAASTVYLFGMVGSMQPSTFASPFVIVVVLTVFGGPLLANLRPDAVGNHFALRKYTGNHPYHAFLIRRSAVHKMHSFKTFAPLVAGPPSAHAELLTRAALHSLIRGRLNLRRALDILVAALPSDSSDNGRLDGVVWFDLGFLLSQTLLDVSFLDEGLLTELRQTGFGPRELYSFRISSFPTFMAWPHRAPWELLDVGAGLKVASGHVSADETFAFDTGASMPLLSELQQDALQPAAKSSVHA